ncbi:MAG: MlaD family protein [Gammaproteobacteria bacterium]|nr:MlaD family protein [Gammaproteobacteria bacterium]
MRNNKTNYALLGSFVLLAFGTLLTAVYMLGGNRGPTHTYYTELRNVAGIKFGTPVTYAGYPLGQVESVTPEQTERGTRYRIEFALREDWRIPEDSLARVVADGLLSAVSIDIEEGTSGSYLQPQGSLRGVSGSNVFTAMNAVAGEFENLSRSALRPLINRLQGSVDVLGQALETTAPALLTNLNVVSQHMSRQLPGSIAQLQALSARLNQQVPDILDDLQVTSAALRANTPKVTAAVRRGVTRLDDVLSEKNVQHVDNILANLDHASSDVSMLVGRLDTAASSVNTLIADVDALMRTSSPQVAAALADMRSSLLSVSDSVDTIGHHLEGSSRNLHEFSRRIRDNPSALLLSTAPQEVSRP